MQNPIEICAEIKRLLNQATLNRTTRLEQVNALINNINNVIDAITNQIRALENDKVNLQHNLADLTRRLEECENNLNRKCSEEEMIKLQEELNHCRNNISDLTNCLQEAHQLLKTLHTGYNTDQEETITKLQATLRKLNTLNTLAPAVGAGSFVGSSSSVGASSFVGASSSAAVPYANSARSDQQPAPQAARSVFVPVPAAAASPVPAAVVPAAAVPAAVVPAAAAAAGPFLLAEPPDTGVRRSSSAAVDYDNQDDNQYILSDQVAPAAAPVVPAAGLFSLAEPPDTGIRRSSSAVVDHDNQDDNQDILSDQVAPAAAVQPVYNNGQQQAVQPFSLGSKPVTDVQRRSRSYAAFDKKQAEKRRDSLSRRNSSGAKPVTGLRPHRSFAAAVDNDNKQAKTRRRNENLLSSSELSPGGMDVPANDDAPNDLSHLTGSVYVPYPYDHGDVRTSAAVPVVRRPVVRRSARLLAQNTTGGRTRRWICPHCRSRRYTRRSMSRS